MEYAVDNSEIKRLMRINVERAKICIDRLCVSDGVEDSDKILVALAQYSCNIIELRKRQKNMGF